ncbi:MAG: TonB-dependent receptor plug domain-containing protein, partial [Bacteroidetes bacterium]|nr:TonB-dependent receptor plug domain-containing protein [Bacteroidota bacterium]
LMLRQGTDGLYEKYIPLAGSPSATKIAEHSNAAALHQKPRAAGKKSTHTKVDLQFFAEGGNLVTGAPCAVAFKAIGPDGLGVSVKGIIKDEQGHKIADFTSSHRGMGVISLVPGPGTRYKAYLIYPDSLDSGIELPKASDSGFRLNIVTTDPRYLTINVSAGAQNHQSTINVVAQSGGKVYYSTTDRIIGGKFSTTVPKDRFPEGIVQFTLFTAKGEPMNERLVFIRNLNEIRLKILDADSVSGPRQKMKINIAAVDGSYQPVSGSFSISVVDETHSPVSDRNSDNILSRLLLASGLHGYIEDPGYYFSADNETVNRNLDLLMLTQGYSRFEWKQILTHTLTAPAVQPEKIHMVTGSIKTLGGKPVPHAKVSMFSVSKAYFAMDTVADDKGHFVFADFPTDSMHYVIQAADKKLRLKTTVTIDNETPPRLIDNAFTENTGAGNDSTLVAYAKFDQHFHDEQLRLGFGKHTTLLKGVVIRGRAATKKYLENSSNLNGPGEANEVITSDQIPPGAPTFKDAIIGHLHGIQYLGGNFYYGSASTLVVLDGMEIQGNLTFKNMQPTIDSEHKGSQSQSDVLNTIPISSIASVEIITDASLAGPYGMRGAGGVIIITTKKWADVLPDKKNIIVHYADYAPPAFYKARVFYSPQYDPDRRRISATDWRTTIFWAPNISTDENGNATIAFYNADSQGSYEVTIEGMDNNGRLGRLVYHYRVK